MKGHGCLKCANRAKLTQEEAEQKLNLRSGEFSYEPFNYINNKTRIICICKKCNKKW
jgi:hypothetical protein